MLFVCRLNLVNVINESIVEYKYIGQLKKHT